ncbi:YqcI/YcgG family protein [Streptomyces sp. SID7982]|nr:YqcI/YcgG family protein [Streptomyces sp. SID7982]
MTARAHGELWTASEAEGVAATEAGWFPEVYREFEDRLLAGGEHAYPCHFGAHGQRLGQNSFSAIDSGPHAAEVLAQVLRQYRERAWEGPRRQSLVVFAGPPDPHARLADHQAWFWSLLGELMELDSVPWPEDVPRDPRDPHWQWSFSGEPWFVFAASPGYRARRSRDLGPCLTMIFQVNRVFKGMGGATPAGWAAKERVRAQLTRYDTIPPHPDLGDKESSVLHKWRQYALPDDDSLPPRDGCPLRGLSRSSGPSAHSDRV